MSTPLIARPAVAPVSASWLTPLELGGLAAVWGASFMFMRIAAADFGPLPLVAVRLVLGSLVLLPFLLKARGSITRAHWPKLALVGALNAAVPFALFAWAARQAPAGISAIANSMTVLFTSLVAFLFYKERITSRRGVALAIGFAGVVVLASSKIEGASPGLAVSAAVFAAFLYGISANMVRRHLTGVPAGAVAASTLGFAALMTLPFALATWPAQSIPGTSWLAAAALGVVCTGAGYVVYYRLIARIGAPRAVTVTYLVPLFGVAWSWLLLGEPVTLTMVIAGTLILGSVALSQRQSS